MGTRPLKPESLVRDGIIPEDLKDDPVVIAVCNDTRLQSEPRKAFLIVYAAMVETHGRKED